MDVLVNRCLGQPQPRGPLVILNHTLLIVLTGIIDRYKLTASPRKGDGLNIMLSRVSLPDPMYVRHMTCAFLRIFMFFFIREVGIVPPPPLLLLAGEGLMQHCRSSRRISLGRPGRTTCRPT